MDLESAREYAYEQSQRAIMETACIQLGINGVLLVAVSLKQSI